MEKSKFKMSRQEAIEAIKTYGWMQSMSYYIIMDMILRSPEETIILQRKGQFLLKCNKREEDTLTERLSRTQRKILYNNLTEEYKGMLTDEMIDIIEGRKESDEPMSQAERDFYSY